MRHSGFSERRLIFLFKEVGHNLGVVGQEIKADVAEAVQDRDPIKLVMAPVVSAARLLFKTPTYIGLGILDKRVQPFNGFETGHNLRETVDELFQLPPHPLRAGIHLINVPESLLLDSLRGLGGFRGRVNSVLNESAGARRN